MRKMNQFPIFTFTYDGCMLATDRFKTFIKTYLTRSIPTHFHLIYNDFLNFTCLMIL